MKPPTAHPGGKNCGISIPILKRKKQGKTDLQDHRFSMKKHLMDIDAKYRVEMLHATNLLFLYFLNKKMLFVDI